MDDRTLTGLIIVGALLAIGAIGGGAVACAKLEQIEPGHVGVSVKKCSGGKITQEPIPVGYYWRELFCEQVIEYPTSMQSLILAKPTEDDITVTSSEGLNINLDVALNFTLEPSKVPFIYERWRAEIDDISHKYMRQTVREASQIIFAKYTAEELYSTKKEIARTEAEAIIIAKLGPQGFVVQQFTINRISPPKQVVAAINSKVAMTQEAQRSEQEVRKKEAEARQQVAVAKGKAEAAVAQAAGEAEAIRIRAEAQAKANEALARSVTPTLIQYEQARRWDGKLPTMTGGAVPMIEVGR